MAAWAVATCGVTVSALVLWWRSSRDLAQLQQFQRQQLELVAAQLKHKEQALKAAEAALADFVAQQSQPGAQPPLTEKPRLYRVVLTGGPCGGKTTALTEIKARLEALGNLPRLL